MAKKSLRDFNGPSNEEDKSCFPLFKAHWKRRATPSDCYRVCQPESVVGGDVESQSLRHRVDTRGEEEEESATSQNPVQERSVNLMTQTFQRQSVIEHRAQSEQTGRDQEDEESDSDDEERDKTFSPGQERKQTGKKKKKKSHQKNKSQHSNRQYWYPIKGLKHSKTVQPQIQTVDQCVINQTPPGTIRIGLLNVRSMNPRASRISELITRNNLDVFLTTETWLKHDTANKVLSKASPEGFRFHYQVRANYSGSGGVANQFSEELKEKRIHFVSLNIKTFEFVVTELQRNDWDQPVVIINLYHPPGYNQERFRWFLNELQTLLNEVSNDYSSIIVTGDFNIPAKKGERCYTDKFDDLLQLYKLTRHVEKPTRISNILDQVITTNVEISNVTVQKDTKSDHSTVYFNAKPKDTRKKTEENKNEEQKGFRKTEE